MGYPTDVRYKRAWVDRGINRNWAADGSDLPQSQAVEVVSVANKAGRLISVQVFSKSTSVYACITIDGVRIDDDGAMETAGNLNITYGCCGLGNMMKLVKYDTVNNQYIFELAQPIQFGNSLDVDLFSYSTGDKASCHVFYEENT